MQLSCLIQTPGLFLLRPGGLNSGGPWEEAEPSHHSALPGTNKALEQGDFSGVLEQRT
ncbi:hypothetical protein I79_025854 [Cricetulus griseus]|uniref:Uncharacterized protein n=1 Tax=Cricetulus griseus TaxID=10029 RepID=G3IPE7_CRIGR|nr:hypothetical protein I79_025854 [Cricetulus griseus]